MGEIIMSGFGTQFVINVNMTPMNGVHMADVDFKAKFYVYTSKVLELDKSVMVKVDEDNYLAFVDSTKVGKGQIKYRLFVKVPDENWESGYRIVISDEVICEECETN
jgi:hypothetical protein